VRSSRLHEWVIPLAVDQTTFRPRTTEERRRTREKHGLPSDAPVLLYVGRLNLQKNLHSLLRLFALVRSEAPDVHLCVVGEEDDIGLHEFGALNTGYVEWLRGLAEDLGLTASISYLGTLFGEDLAQVYAAADVVVNASFYHRENFGLAQAEGQACGTPVVCTSWGGFKDVVLDGETGYLIDAVLTKQGVRVDWATGAQRMLSLLRDPDLRQRMGERASALARCRFSIEAMSRDLSDAIASLVARPSQRSPASSAYSPSRFAARYEAHKRACGWYADADPSGPSPRTWFPQMYQGRDYRLYERLMEPYATRLSSDLAPSHIRADWIPYWSSGAALEPVRHRISNDDPVWPHWAFLRPVEWKVARSIDGHTSVGEIRRRAIADGWTTDESTVGTVLQYLYREGFVLFCDLVASGGRPDG
jgi:hypothetical protein